MSKADLEFYGSCTLDQDGCATCGDVAVPVRVLEITGSDALVEDRVGLRATVAIDFFPEAKAGDALLVHMGVAISQFPSPRPGALGRGRSEAEGARIVGVREEPA